MLKRISGEVEEENPDRDLMSLHCIIHQESVCRSVKHLNNIVNPVAKLVKFMRLRWPSAPPVHCSLRRNRCR